MFNICLSLKNKTSLDTFASIQYLVESTRTQVVTKTGDTPMPESTTQVMDKALSEARELANMT